MLNLTRKPGEAIIINGNIEVRVLGIDGLQVRLGIDAPKEVVVDREEIHLKKVNGQWDNSRDNKGNK